MEKIPRRLWKSFKYSPNKTWWSLTDSWLYKGHTSVAWECKNKNKLATYSTPWIWKTRRQATGIFKISFFFSEKRYYHLNLSSFSSSYHTYSNNLQFGSAALVGGWGLSPCKNSFSYRISKSFYCLIPNNHI